MGSETDFCITSAGFRYKAGSAAGSLGYQEETAPTLLAGQQSGVLSSCYADLIVCRLTPLECERLQGFGDFWTECGHDGRAVSDTSRYQMLGNSIYLNKAIMLIMGTKMA